MHAGAHVGVVLVALGCGGAPCRPRMIWLGPCGPRQSESDSCVAQASRRNIRTTQKLLSTVLTARPQYTNRLAGVRSRPTRDADGGAANRERERSGWCVLRTNAPPPDVPRPPQTRRPDGRRTRPRAAAAHQVPLSQPPARFSQSSVKAPAEASTAVDTLEPGTGGLSLPQRRNGANG